MIIWITTFREKSSMTLTRVCCTIGLICAAVWSTAAGAQSPAPSAPPTPAAMHAMLTQIEADPALRGAAIARGQKSASVCRHCHGVGGNSVMADVPNLASQNAAYLLEQMNKFIAGQRKSSPFMAGMIKALTPQERVDIALFLAAQPVVNPTATATDAAGKQLYGKLCVTCHGASGSGSSKIPRLAGQQIAYVEDSLKRYRSGSGERIDPLMAAYTRGLNDADIRRLAAYLATLRP
jgi:cytochrome c553